MLYQDINIYTFVSPVRKIKTNTFVRLFVYYICVTFWAVKTQSQRCNLGETLIILANYQ